MKKWVISAVGKDHPGIVSAFTQVLFDTGCNVEDTSMTILEDHFTMLLIIETPETMTIPVLESRLQSVAGSHHLHVSVYGIDTENENPGATGSPWMISVSGSDQTGIMYHVTHYLGRKGINIRHLSSKRVPNPDGLKLFLMAIEVDVPQALDEDQILDELKVLGLETDLDIHAEPLDVYTL